jgi:hypothetical protein
VCALALAQAVPPASDTTPVSPAATPATAPPAAAAHEITPAETEAARSGAPKSSSAPAEQAPPAPADAASAPPTGDATTSTDSAAAGAAGPTAADSGVAQPSRSDAYAEFRRLFDDRQYQQALVPAQQVVKLSEQQGAGDDLQVALMNLAATQSLTEDYVEAEATYLRVI